MAKSKKKQHKNKKVLVIAIIIVILGLLSGYGVGVENGAWFHPKATVILKLDDEKIDATITNENGEEEVIKDVETVESVEGNQKFEDLPDVAQGAYHDTSSWIAYKNATLGACTDVDGVYGAQCFDLASDFWKNYSGRWLSSCGTGAAKGTVNCWQQNAGNDFVMVWDKTKLQAGDWVVFDSGQYGHIGMALGEYNKGYVTLLGQNQGGGYCFGGGSSANIININLNSFIGAFRPKSYIKPEPKPTPAPQPKDSGFKTYTYKKGDYFSKVLKELKLDEGKLWGEDGTVKYYTKQLIQQDMLDSRGNVKIGKQFTLIER